MNTRNPSEPGVALIKLDNPPVNGMGFDTRQAVWQALEQAQSDPQVAAIVVMGAGSLFSAGADIREFGSPKAYREPNLLSLIARVEAYPKPVIAAMHGT